MEDTFQLYRGCLKGLLSLTRRVRIALLRNDLEEASNLLSRRQAIIEEIQKIDISKEGKPLSEDDINASHDISAMIKNILEFDKEIRLYVTSTKEDVLRELKSIRMGKEALRGYKKTVTP